VVRKTRAEIDMRRRRRRRRKEGGMVVVLDCGS
jgi:hypothetical protein